MKIDFDHLEEGLRSQRKSKKRKRNFIISAFIMIVLLLSLFLVVKGVNQPSDQTVKVTKGESSTPSKPKVDQPATDPTQSDQPNETPSKDQPKQNEQNPKPEQGNIANSDPNVLETQVGKWAPIGTIQSEPHTTQYAQDSTDWKEMINAIEMATGLAGEKMIVWWLGNGGAPDQSIATVSSTDEQEIYRVELKWVESEGWMPTKLERLKKNDRK